MDDTWTLILLSLAMFIGCYLAGSFPLAVSLSEARLKLVTVFGAGLLVGTALAVIIPEGVHALMTPSQHNLFVKSVSSENSDLLPTGHNQDRDHDHGHDKHHSDATRWIGVSLTLGFVFMLLVDQIGGSAHPANTNDGGNVPQQNRYNMTATLGLVVHAAADGIALGAAASTSQVGVEMIVFIAIMLHKAPAAFGLVTFLMHEGFDRDRIRKHLFVFALSAPIMALLTYFCLGQRSKEVLSEVSATGIVMLFSGGTFLYVAAVHILPELKHLGSTQQPLTSALPETTVPTSHSHKSGFTNLEVTAMVLGCLFPLFISMGHHH